MIRIIGAGLAGLSAALTLAEQGYPCDLISAQPSERAQSVLAEGGINAALDTMGEHDTVQAHFADTVKGGCGLCDENAVAGLVRNAPGIVESLIKRGVPFHMQNGRPVLRNFGGQKNKRTAYAKSSTGKVIMTAMTDAVRKYEVSGLIRRFPHHEMLCLLTENGCCTGVRILDTYTGETADLSGTVILCSGGLNGLFPEKTTGTTLNTGDGTAAAFCAGAVLGNPEMLQYHPTTVGISGKRCLVSEAARGEGGRLFIERNGSRWYFMEEKYPELKNLMPRDVVAREMYFVRHSAECGDQVYLDLTGLSETVWEKKLSDLRAELMRYLALDPKTQPVPVEEGIHYFMGGLDTDIRHRTNLPGLYAAGECTCQYHGANRLGGNSILGALYGGQTAANTVMAEHAPEQHDAPVWVPCDDPFAEQPSAAESCRLRDILMQGLGIVRDENTLLDALSLLSAFAKEPHCARMQRRILLGEAMLRGALARKESRGAHYRADFPQPDAAYQKETAAQYDGNGVTVGFRPIGKLTEAL